MSAPGIDDILHYEIIRLKIPRTTFQSKMPMMINGRPTIISTTKARLAKNALVVAMLDRPPEKPIEGPCTLIISYFFEAPKVRQKLFKDPAVKSLPMTVKPDLDNLLKGTIDSMVAAKWILNDQQVYRICATKREVRSDESITIQITQA